MATEKKKKVVGNKRVRRWARGPLFWILLALVVVSIFGRLSNTGNQYQKVSTSTILQAIADGKVDSALVIDKDQKIEVR